MVPADFDGDLVTDFLLVYSSSESLERRYEVCYGSPGTKHYTCLKIDGETTADDPTVIE